MYATRSVAYIDMPYSGYYIIMYIEACIRIPEIYGYNVNMSLHGGLCTIYIHTYTQVPPSM